ncbi:MAG: plastocyanin/azurin family copper-binding protein [Gaiellaceae bacterium]
MTGRLSALVVLLAVAALAIGSSSLAASKATTLTGTTGPGFTISLKMGGKVVKTLPAGTYKLVVSDKSSSHDFHLIGPGLNMRVTTVPFKGTKTVTVKLAKDKYVYKCDPHAALGMKGSFTVN